MNDPLLNMIGLCKRAGRLLLGFDIVKRAVLRNEVCLVLTASDLSERTVQAVKRLCSQGQPPVRPIKATLAQLEWMVGKRAGVLAITDQGLAQKIQSLANREDEEECVL